MKVKTKYMYIYEYISVINTSRVTGTTTVRENGNMERGRAFSCVIPRIRTPVLRCGDERLWIDSNWNEKKKSINLIDLYWVVSERDDYNITTNWLVIGGESIWIWRDQRENLKFGGKRKIFLIGRKKIDSTRKSPGRIDRSNGKNRPSLVPRAERGAHHNNSGRVAFARDDRSRRGETGPVTTTIPLFVK